MEWPVVAFLMWFIKKPISSTEKMQYLKPILTGQAKANAATSGMGFSSQLYYHALDILCQKYGRSDVIANSQLKKNYNHPQVRHDNSTSVVKIANMPINVVNTFQKSLTQLGYTSDLESGGRSSTTSENFLCKREQ